MLYRLSDRTDTRDRCYDVCIVGSGPAGTAVLETIVRGTTDLDVCVLESGDLESTAFSDGLRDVVSDGLWIKPSSRERTVGGASTTWTGLSTLIDPVVVKERTGLAGSGWPIDYGELLDYYGKASREYGFPPVAYFENDGSKHSDRLGVETPDWTTIEEKLFLRPDDLPDFRGRLLARADDEDCDLFVGSTVTHLDGDADSGAARVANVKDSGGRSHAIRAQRFVLGCGGIENPRLMLNSSFACADGLGNEKDQVGRYFMNHPKGNFGKIRLSSADNAIPYTLGSLSFEDGYTGHLGLRATEDVQRANGTMNAYVRFRPLSLWPTSTESDRSRVGSLGDVASALGRVGHRSTTSLRRLGERLRTGSVRTVAYGIRNFMEMEPRPGNRVVLADETDAFGVPKAKVRYSLSERDKRSVVDLHDRLREELSDSDWGDAISSLRGDVTPWPVTTDASHHMGATRMGSDASTSVVDEHCRVHSTPNVYVAGSSVFPTSGNANPTWTIVALGIRLGEHLCEATL